MQEDKSLIRECLCNGLLAGLVAITAPCAFVNSIAAVIIGAVAGVLVIVVYNFVDRKLKIDDPVGAFAVHGANGAWGVLSLGLFADGSYGDGWNGVPGTVKGLFYGDGKQFLAELHWRLYLCDICFCRDVFIL